MADPVKIKGMASLMVSTKSRLLLILSRVSKTFLSKPSWAREINQNYKTGHHPHKGRKGRLGNG